MRTFELGPELQVIFDGDVVPFRWDREQLAAIKGFKDLVAFTEVVDRIIFALAKYSLTDDEQRMVVLYLRKHLLTVK